MTLFDDILLQLQATIERELPEHPQASYAAKRIVFYCVDLMGIEKCCQNYWMLGSPFSGIHSTNDPIKYVVLADYFSDHSGKVVARSDNEEDDNGNKLSITDINCRVFLWTITQEEDGKLFLYSYASNVD